MLLPADLAVSVDLVGKLAGEATLQLNSSQFEIPYGANVVRISPAQLRLRLVNRRETPPALAR